MAIQDDTVQVPDAAEFIPGLNWDSLNEMIAKAKAKYAGLKDKFGQMMSKLTAAQKAAMDKLNKQKKSLSRQASGNSSAGIFNDIVCCKVPNFGSRLGTLNFDLGLGRFLNFDRAMYLNICGNQKKLNLRDALSGMANFIQKNPGILSFDKDIMLATLMRSDFMNKADLFGIKRLIRDCLLRRLTNAQAGLFGSDGSFGPSLKSRNYLRKKMAQDPCLSAIGQIPFVSNFLTHNNLGLLISSLASMLDPNEDKDSMFAILDSVFNILGMRDTVIAGLGKSLGYAVDYNYFRVKDKIKVINRYKQLGIIKPMHAGSLQVRPNILIERLDKDTIYEQGGEAGSTGGSSSGGSSAGGTTGSSSSSGGNGSSGSGSVPGVGGGKVITPEEAENELNNFIEGLDTVAPGWTEEEVACSITLQDWTKKTLSNRRPGRTVEPVYTTRLDRVERIALISKFNCCKGCKPKNIMSAPKASCNCA